VSVPYGVMSYGAPASYSASHTWRPCHQGTLISKASSPEKLIRHTRASHPATMPSRQDMNPKLSLSTSMSVTVDSTSRDFGPARATVANCSVTEVRYTCRCVHSVCSQSSSQASTLAALPDVVVTRYRYSPVRVTVPSSNTMPSAVHITPYRIRPTLRVLIMLV